MFSLLRALLLGCHSLLSARLDTAVRVAALEQQLATYQARGVRPRISFFDRLFWIALRRCWARWKDALIFVKPETVIGWDRKVFRLFWRWRCKQGRPPIEQELILMIIRISSENRGWGARRIVAELQKLGHIVSAATARKYMVRPASGPSGSRRSTQSWKTFLKNQGHAILACDFLTQHTAGFRNFYVFVVLHVGTRKVLRATVTEGPSLPWVKNQLRHVFAFEHPYKFVIHDNDGIFGQFGAPTRKLCGFRCHLDQWLRAAMGVRGIPTPYRAPNANAYVERFNRAIRDECLNHFIFLGERHLQRVIDEYVDYYNHARPSQGTGCIPHPRDGPANESDAPVEPDCVSAHPVLGGLHHDYRRAA
jgi:putative transposase